MIHVRPYVADDRTFVLSLAPRLLIGMPPWRDPQLWLPCLYREASMLPEHHHERSHTL